MYPFNRSVRNLEPPNCLKNLCSQIFGKQRDRILGVPSSLEQRLLRFFICDGFTSGIKHLLSGCPVQNIGILVLRSSQGSSFNFLCLPVHIHRSIAPRPQMSVGNPTKVSGRVPSGLLSESTASGDLQERVPVARPVRGLPFSS